ncbi:hypothetical protein LTR94_029735, partial [Friedmanniomyces endolithicus]
RAVRLCHRFRSLCGRGRDLVPGRRGSRRAPQGGALVDLCAPRDHRHRNSGPVRADARSHDRGIRPGYAYHAGGLGDRHRCPRNRRGSDVAQGDPRRMADGPVWRFICRSGDHDRRPAGHRSAHDLAVCRLGDRNVRDYHWRCASRARVQASPGL